MANSGFRLRSLAWRLGTLSAILLLCHGSQALWLGQDIDSSALSVFHIHGVVLNALTSKPIGRVLVTAIDAATMTNSDGRFELELRLSTGNAASGFGSKLDRRGVASGGIPVGVIARRPGYLNMPQPPILMLTDQNSDLPELEIKLIPESILRGRITTPTETLPLGVQVLLLQKQIQDGVSRWSQVTGAPSNSRGEYRIADLPAGDYKVMTREWIENGSLIPVPGVQVTGYPPAYYPNEATPIHIAAGETVQADLNLRAEPYYRVTIPIANFLAKNGVNVEVKDRNGSSGFSLGFNPQSQMIEGFLPSGAYSVRVTSFGPVLSIGIGRIDVAEGPIQGSRISLTAAGIIPVIVREEYTADSDKRMSLGVGLDNGGNRPSRPLNLGLQPDQENGLAATLRPPPAKGNDDLVIENVWEGKYRLYVTPFRGYVASATSNGVDLLRNLLVVGANRTSAPIEITLRDDTASLDGTVNIPAEGAQKTDQKGLFVHCIPLDNKFGGQVRTAVVADGKFSLQNLSPGRYLVLGSSKYPSNLEYRNDEVLRQSEANGTIVTLEPGQKTVITMSKIVEDEE